MLAMAGRATVQRAVCIAAGPLRRVVCPTPRPPAARDLSFGRASGPLQLHGLLTKRSMSTEAGMQGDSLLSSVFGDGSADGGAAAVTDETADRHQNRHSKAGTLAAGKKTLKPWAGGGGAQLTEQIFDVGSENIKILIGKRGIKVHSMMEESGAKIFISRQPGQDSSTRKIAIRGTAEAVAKAKELVMAQVRYAQTAAAHLISKVLKIPVSHTGIIIGKSGATVKSIESETGAMVKLDTKYVGRSQPPLAAFYYLTWIPIRSLLFISLFTRKL